MSRKKKESLDPKVQERIEKHALEPEPGPGGVRIASMEPLSSWELRLLVLRAATCTVPAADLDKASTVVMSLLDAYEATLPADTEGGPWVDTDSEAMSLYRSTFYKYANAGLCESKLPVPIRQLLRWPRWLLEACGRVDALRYNEKHPVVVYGGADGWGGYD